MRNRLIVTTLIVTFFVSCTIKKNVEKDSVEYINSFIGSTGPTDSDYGGTIPSVAPPFAMTQWCAMTRDNYISFLKKHTRIKSPGNGTYKFHMLFGIKDSPKQAFPPLHYVKLPLLSLWMISKIIFVVPITPINQFLPCSK
jgi:hypothetical protein